jgi:hypothetical protein
MAQSTEADKEGRRGSKVACAGWAHYSFVALWPALFEAMKRVDFSGVRQLCSANATLVHERIEHIYRGTAVHMACRDIKDENDALRMVAMLLDELHADANATDDFGTAPAHEAAGNGEWIEVCVWSRVCFRCPHEVRI